MNPAASTPDPGGGPGAAAVRSEVVESGLIFSLVIDGQAFDPWQPEEGTGLHRRSGRLTVRVTTVRKGSLEQRPDEPFELAIEQRGTASLRVTDYYGLWSHTPTATGTRLTAFCDGAVTDAREALTDGHCERLDPTDAVEGDLTVALDLEERNASSAAVLAEAERVKASCGALFGRFVWVRARDLLLSSPDAFSRLMAIAEDPDTTLEARECYLSAAYEDAGFTEAFSVEQEARLARAMARTALDEDVGELRNHILETYLVNLAGVAEGSPAHLSLGDVFGSEQDLLGAVRDAAARRPEVFARPLQDWLAGGEQ